MDGIDIPDTLAEATELLTPRPLGLVPFQIRAQWLALQNAESGADAAVPVVADYYIGAILDLPDADVPITSSLLGTWNADIDAVVAAAAANRAQSEADVQTHEDAFVIIGVPFAAAALRNPAAVSGISPDATPVIIVPDPGLVILAFAEDEASLRSAARAAELALANAQRTVSATPLVRAGDGWQPFDWPEALREDVQRLRRRWDSVQYTAAQPVLQQTYTFSGREVHVAEHALAQGPGGETVTYATITEGVRTVVPRVDSIMLTADDGRVARVAFADVEAIPDVLSPVPGTVPEYLLVERFPSELL